MTVERGHPMLPILLLADALESAAARAKDATAITAAHRMTYGELDGHANALAFALQRRGVEPGDRVLALVQGPEQVVAFWAAQKAGVVYVPIEPADLESGALLGHDARALIVDAALHSTFHHAVARAPKVRAVIARGPFDASSATGVASYVSWETVLGEETSHSTHGAPERGATIDLDDAWLARSAKGASRPFCVVSQRALLSRGACIARALSLGEKDSIGGALSVPELAVACALSGASILWRAPHDAAALEPTRKRRKQGAARQLWLTGEADPPEGATAVHFYARSECGPIALFSDGAESGVVAPNVHVHVVDDKGQRVRPNVVGEIVVRSSGLFSHWVRGIDATPAQEYRTGDSGMLDETGRLYLMD